MDGWTRCVLRVALSLATKYYSTVMLSYTIVYTRFFLKIACMHILRTNLIFLEKAGVSFHVQAYSNRQKPHDDYQLLQVIYL